MAFSILTSKGKTIVSSTVLSILTDDPDFDNLHKAKSDYNAEIQPYIGNSSRTTIRDLDNPTLEYYDDLFGRDALFTEGEFERYDVFCRRF